MENLVEQTSPTGRFSCVDYRVENIQVDSVGCGTGPKGDAYSEVALELSLP